MRGRVSTVGGAAILVGVVAVGVVGAVLVQGTAPAELAAIFWAAAVAGGAAVAGWCVARLGHGRAAGLAVAGGLGATLVRLLPVLAALGWITSREQGTGADRSGALLVIFYLVLLATDVLLNMIGGGNPDSARRSKTMN